MMRSGLSSRLRGVPQVWNSTHAELRQREIALGVLDARGRICPRPRSSSVSNVATEAGHAGEGMALEEAVLRHGRSGSGTSDTGRPKMCGSMKSPTKA